MTHLVDLWLPADNTVTEYYAYRQRCLVYYAYRLTGCDLHDLAREIGRAREIEATESEWYRAMVRELRRRGR